MKVTQIRTWPPSGRARGFVRPDPAPSPHPHPVTGPLERLLNRSCTGRALAPCWAFGTRNTEASVRGQRSRPVMQPGSEPCSGSPPAPSPFLLSSTSCSHTYACTHIHALSHTCTWCRPLMSIAYHSTTCMHPNCRRSELNRP